MSRPIRLLLSLVLALAVSLPCAAANLLSNPGFESGVPGMVPTGWTRWNASWSTGYAATTDAAAKYNGSYGLKESITGSASFGVHQQVNVTPGRAYKLNGMWKAVTAGSGNWFEIILLDGVFDIDQADSAPGVFNSVVAGWDANSAFGHPAPPSWDWEPFSATYGNEVSPYIHNGVRTASGSKMTVVLKIGCNSPTKPVVYFDDITLTPVPSATVMAPNRSLTRTGPVTFQVSFADLVTGFNSPSDVEIISTGTASAGTVTVTGGMMAPYMVTLSDITGGGSLAVKVKANAAQNSDGNGNLESSVSNPVIVLESDGSIAEVKEMGDGALVELAGKHMSFKWPSFAYIQEPDRTCGIRLEGYYSAGNLGQPVILVGTLNRPVGQEPYVFVTQIAPYGTGTALPLAANNSALRSSLLDGMLVTAWGVVKSVGDSSYVISDGSDAGITVHVQGAPGVTAGEFVTVTGAAGRIDGERVIYKGYAPL